jgi:lipoprotein-anchoring transpeptidase ErfK/SrfK
VEVNLSFPKIFIGVSIILFLGIGVVAFVQKRPNLELKRVQSVQENVQIQPVKAAAVDKNIDLADDPHMGVDRIRKFFCKGMDKLPIVETVTYTSRVDWLKGRPAWIADYAAHFQTSRHFIARGLNGTEDYETQKVSPGEKFNVFRLDKEIQFYLFVDLKKCTMDFYYLDLDLNQRVFLKRYFIAVGKEDPKSPSGSLTPIGKYTLGPKVAIYKPGVEHYFQNQKIQMIEVFGTRWLPFEEELENCSDSAKGYGIHGVPCKFNPENGALVEQGEGVGARNSDGCLRLTKTDVEELFSIVITKPTIIEIVKDGSGHQLPMATEINLD